MDENRVMDRNTIIEYLENVVELEKQVYTQKITLNTLDAKANSLGIARSFQEPRVGYINNSAKSENIGRGLAIGGMIGFIPPLVACGSCEAVMGLTFIGSIIGALAGLVINLENQQSVNEKYEAALQEYEAAKYHDAVRVKRELEQRESIISERNALYSKYLETCDVLQRYYDSNIVYGKYHHDFAAVASFLDYFKSGRCSTFGENRGGDGAYNMYANELHQNIIINKLDRVIKNLNEIKENQYTLAEAISEGNRISQGLVSATERLALAEERHAENSAIAAYNSERAANELNQIKWLKIWEQK